jgi:hypothetical protein
VSAVRVSLLTAAHCHLCEQAKEVLDRVGANYDIEVETLSADSEQGQALMLEHLIAFPPGVLLDGKAFSYGRLSERKLRRELDRTGAVTKVPTDKDTIRWPRCPEPHDGSTEERGSDRDQVSSNAADLVADQPVQEPVRARLERDGRSVHPAGKEGEGLALAERVRGCS